MSGASAQFDRYLAVLGVPRRCPSVGALAELTAAHLAHVPFENISKLYFRNDPSRRGVPDLAGFLHGIERYRFGGTCYAINYHFSELLIHLGYEATLCGADMAAPNVHMVNLVTLDGRQYLVDVGYAAPFVEPIPMDDESSREITWGPTRYIVRRLLQEGRPRVDLYRDGVLRHSYVVNPVPRRLEDFAGVIDESFAERATFMHAVLIACFGAARSVTLRNLTLTEVESGRCRVVEIPISLLPEVIQREFGMPRKIVQQALNGVELTKEP